MGSRLWVVGAAAAAALTAFWEPGGARGAQAHSPPANAPVDRSAEAALSEAARAAFEGYPEEAIARLQALVQAAGTPDPVRVRANFLLGTLLVRADRPAEAGAPLADATADPLVADYALARLGQARRAAGDPKGATRALARLLADHPASPLADPAWRDLGEAAAEAGDLSSAEGALREALARARGSAARAEAQFLLAEVLARAGRGADAAPLLRDLWLALPMTREADRAFTLLTTLPGAPSITQEDRFLRAMRLYRGGAYAKAAGELAPFAEGIGARAGQARLALGIARFHARDYQKAVRALEPLLSGAARGGRAEVLFWLARSYGRLGDRPRFLALLEELMAVAPHHDRVDTALFYLAGGYLEDGRPDRAAEALDRLIRHHPQSEHHEAAQWGRGWLWYRQGQYAFAADAFRKLAARAVPWWPQATYWEGRAREAGGQRKAARHLYEHVAQGQDQYYASLARARLGRKGNPPAPSPQIVAAPGPPGNHARLAVARALGALWLAEEATDEYWALVRSHPEDRGLLAEAVAAFLRLERVERAVLLAKRVLWPQYLQAGETPPIPAFWDALYPQAYWNPVARQASTLQLDPFLVLAVIREESAFARQAVSSAGARGLMQLMPHTAARLARAHRLRAPGGTSALDDPAYNIALGAAELADLLDDFQGDLVLALAGYNAGPHNVRRWIQEAGYPGPEEFVEEIRFPETRAYVKRVLGSYNQYRALYGGGDPATTAGASHRGSEPGDDPGGGPEGTGTEDDR